MTEAPANKDSTSENVSEKECSETAGVTSSFYCLITLREHSQSANFSE